MKAFIALILCAALASAEYRVKTSAEVNEYITECVDRASERGDRLEKSPHSNYGRERLSESNMACVLEKMEIINPRTGINMWNLHQQIEAGGHYGGHAIQSYTLPDKTAHTDVFPGCEWAVQLIVNKLCNLLA